MFPQFLQQDTCIDLHAGLYLYIVKRGNNSLFLPDGQPVAIDQYQQVNIAIRAGIAPRFAAVENSLCIRSNT